MSQTIIMTFHWHFTFFFSSSQALHIYSDFLVSIHHQDFHILFVSFSDNFYAISPLLNRQNFRYCLHVFVITFVQFLFCLIIQIVRNYLFSFLVTFTQFIFCYIIKIFTNHFLYFLTTFT